MVKAVQEEEVWPELQHLLCEVGSRVKELRDHRGMTQKDLAAACDLKQPYVFEIERGTANLTMKTLLRVANALGVTPRDLLAAATSLEGEHRLLLDSVKRLLGSLRKITDEEQRVVSTIIDKPQVVPESHH